MSAESRRPGDPTAAETFPQLIRAAAAAYGDAVALRLKRPGMPDEEITFAELDRRSAELARGLIARGVGKGSRIGFIHGNGPDFALTFAAIARTGAVAIPVSTFIKSNELVRVLRQSDVAGLILQRSLLGKDYVQRLCDALPELRDTDSPELRLPAAPYLRWIVSTGDGLPPGMRDLGWITGAAGAVDEALLRAIENEVHPADQMVEIYTSGSMALPKGVKHNHGPMLYRTHFIRSRTPGAEPGGQLPAIMPMFWIGGMIMYLLPHWEAGTTTLCSERNLSDSRIAMGTVMAEDDVYQPPEGSTLWALGMTETIGPYSWGDEFRAPGYPLCPPLDHIAERYEVRVADGHGRPVAEGERGEIQVRGYALTPGLHKIERDACFEPDGFYRTGDMGVVEGERIHFVGRDGDMIKTSSANVSPSEVELEMQQLPGVHSAYVLGLPDPERGQLVVAAVVPRDGAVLDFEGIEQKLQQRLSSYKVPRRYLAIRREEVPMLHSNKVARRELAALLARRLGQS